MYIKADAWRADISTPLKHTTTTMTKLATGDLVPVITFTTFKGETVSLANSKTPLIHLQFRRYAGCPIYVTCTCAQSSSARTSSLRSAFLRSCSSTRHRRSSRSTRATSHSHALRIRQRNYTSSSARRRPRVILMASRGI